ncbi:hypothetical protein ACQ4LE_001812 [Meloidogyne hapla]|uniref:MIF4G domain-containing protein n=1 Tax=Meloidogyne hapla TaxID=6305 RepID=A0A1I8BC58_MELHA
MTSTRYSHWIEEMTLKADRRQQNIKTIRDTKPFDQHHLSSLDDTPDNLTAFTEKLKNISTSSIYQLLPDLDKLNLSRYLDEIATSICEAANDTSDLIALVNFCVKVSSLYKQFSMYLLNEFKKQMPSKKGDKVENPSKLRVCLSFFTELFLNGIFGREGFKLNILITSLVKTDKLEHLNTSVLIPFCNDYFLPLTGILPYSKQKHVDDFGESEQQFTQLTSTLFSKDDRDILIETLDDYRQSLVVHTMECYEEMNILESVIINEKRKRGDASADDRQRFELTKQHFERLHFSLDELNECLGHPPIELPPEESSDDDAAAHRLSGGLKGTVQNNNTHCQNNITQQQAKKTPKWLEYLIYGVKMSLYGVKMLFITGLNLITTAANLMVSSSTLMLYFVIIGLIYTRLDRMEDKITSFSGKLNAFETKINKMENNFTKTIKTQIDDAFENKIDDLKIYINSTIKYQIDGLENKMNGKIDGLEKEMNKKIDGLEKKFDKKIEKSISDLEKNLDHRFKAIDDKFKAIDDKFKAVDDRFIAVNDRIDGVNDRLDAISSRIFSTYMLVKAYFPNINITGH